MIFRTWTAAALFCSMLAFSGLSAQMAKDEKPKRGGHLTFGALKDIVTTNPFRQTYSLDYDIRSVVFEGLTGLDQNAEPVPVLATRWDISKDGLAYTFFLRNGVKFHNGQPLTSKDVKWSLDYLRNPKNRAYYLDQVTDVKSVEAPEPHKIVLTLAKPFAPLIVVVGTARAPVLPAGTELSPTAYPPGTGPFKFAEWKAGNHLTLEAFKEYWMPGIPYLDKITFRPIADDSVRVTALRAGEIDVADELPYSAVAEAKKSKPGYTIIPWEAAARRRINLNTRIPPFNDVRVRQAVAYAIDKKELAEGLTWGFGEPINQRYPKNNKWFIDLPHREQNLEKAKALLAEAGYKDGLKVKAPVYPGPDMEFTTVIKDQLKKAGIDLEFDVMDWAAHSKLRRAHKHTLYAAGMGLRPDPDQVYYADLYSKSRNNNSGYSNPEVDRMLEQARRTSDITERKRLYTEVLKFIERDVPEIYVYMAPKFLGVQRHVKGFTTGSLEDLFYYVGGGIQHTWLDR